jgi:DNA-directed RNA polymerase subunit beta'
MGAEAHPEALETFDLDAEAKLLREHRRAPARARRRLRALKRLKVVAAFQQTPATRPWAWCSTPSR